MTVWVGDERSQLHPGGICFLPRQLPHAYRVDTDCRMIILNTPAGQENLFRAAGWDLSQPKPTGWQVSPDRLSKAVEQSGVTIVGPPHGLDD
jgi:hypothetical protein